MGDNYTWFQGEEDDDFGSGGPTHYESDKDERESIEDKLNDVPEGTDFLTPEDVQPLFDNREVIFDV